MTAKGKVKKQATHEKIPRIRIGLLCLTKYRTAEITEYTNVIQPVVMTQIGSGMKLLLSHITSQMLCPIPNDASETLTANRAEIMTLTPIIIFFWLPKTVVVVVDMA